MSINQAPQAGPVVPVRIELQGSLAQACAPKQWVDFGLPAALQTRLDALLQTLGLPGKSRLEISSSLDEPGASSQFLRLWVHGRRVRYPDDLPAWVYAYVTGQLGHAAAHLPEIAAWLAEPCERREGSPEAGPQIEFFCLACLEAVQAQPGVLVSRSQVEDYRTRLLSRRAAQTSSGNHSAPPVDWFLEVLRTVVGLGISVADLETVDQQLQASAELSPEEAAEGLVAALRPGVIEIHLPHNYWRALTLNGPDNGMQVFPDLRQTLFQDLGLVLPPFQFVVDNDLKENSFAFKINHLLRVSRLGLPVGECLVDADPGQLYLWGVVGVETLNPESLLPASLAPLTAQEDLKDTGLTTSSLLEYLLFCLSAQLRRSAASLLDLTTVQDYLRKEREYYPSLCQVAAENFSEAHLTRLLRALLAEEESVRNLRLILERRLDYPAWLEPAARLLLLTDPLLVRGRPEALPAVEFDRQLACVRAGLRSQINARHRWPGSDSLFVYRVGPEIEHLVEAWEAASQQDESPPPEEEVERIVQAIRRELNLLPDGSGLPALLTTLEVRARLRQAIAAEFPRIAVLAEHELEPGSEVETVAQI